MSGLRDIAMGLMASALTATVGMTVIITVGSIKDVLKDKQLKKSFGIFMAVSAFIAGACLIVCCIGIGVCTWKILF